MKKKKAKMGRPPKSAQDKRSGQVMVRLTISEQKRLEAEAKKAGVPLATYIHIRITKGA